MAFRIKTPQPNKSQKRYLTIFVAVETYDKAATHAERHGISVQELTIQALEYVVDGLEQRRNRSGV